MVELARGMDKFFPTAKNLKRLGRIETHKKQTSGSRGAPLAGVWGQSPHGFKAGLVDLFGLGVFRSVSLDERSLGELLCVLGGFFV